MTTFPEIYGLLQAPCSNGAMRYQLQAGRWVTCYAQEAVLYAVPHRRNPEDIGGVLDTLTHDGTSKGIEGAVRTLLNYAATS